MEPYEYAGCALMFAAIITAQLPQRRSRKDMPPDIGKALWCRFPDKRHGRKAGMVSRPDNTPGDRPDVLGAGRMSGEIPLTMPGENVMMRKHPYLDRRGGKMFKKNAQVQAASA